MHEVGIEYKDIIKYLIGHNYIPSEILQATQSLTLCNNTEKSGDIFLLSAMLVVHTGEPYHCTMPPRLSPPVPESKIEVCSPSCVFQLQEING